MLRRTRMQLFGMLCLVGLPANGVLGEPIDEFFELEEQIVDAQDAYTVAMEKLSAKSAGKTDKKPGVDGRPAILKQMDALTKSAYDKPDGSAIAFGTFFWSWNLDLDLENLYSRFENIVKHFPDDPGMDDVLPATVDAAFTPEAPSQWARTLNKLAKKTKRDKTRTSALITLGQLQLRANQPGSAKLAFKRVIALKPDEEIKKLAEGYLYECKHLQVGMPAPDFKAKTLKGRTRSLESFRGKAVLLNFWASW